MLKNYAMKTAFVMAVTKVECVSKPVHVINKMVTSLIIALMTTIMTDCEFERIREGSF